MHQFLQRCRATLEQIMGSDTERMAELDQFDGSCVDEVNPAIFMQAIEQAHCPEDDPIFTIYVARADGDTGIVSSIANGNVIKLNGEVQGTFAIGEVWTAGVSSGDIITGSGPIYGVVQTTSSVHVREHIAPQACTS
jgi:hypothetical protein